MMLTDVLVYELFGDDELRDRAAGLPEALQFQPGSRGWFEGLPGGCFRWEDESIATGEAAQGSLLDSATAARRAAQQFMRDVNAAYESKSRSVERPASGQLLPFAVDILRPGAVRRVSARGARREHWFSSWTAWLPTTPGSEGGRAPVWGATVEIRVTGLGSTMAVVSRVRPWRRAQPRPVYEITPAEKSERQHEAGEHAHRHDGAREDATFEQPSLVYVADNPFEPQRYWSPCWLVAPDDEEEHHHSRRLWPACDHTILPEILIMDEAEETSLWAEVLGPQQTSQVVEHGDTWRLHWSVASLPDLLVGSRTETEGTHVSLGEGLYQVGLQVTHVPTGATGTTTTQVPVGMSRDGSGGAPPNDDLVS